MHKAIVKLKSNLMLKLISLVFAFLIWSFVLSETNPVREKAFDNVSVTITGEQTLNENGLVIIGNWTDKLKNLRIDTEVLRNDYFLVTPDDFKVTLDLSSIQTPGTYELRLDVTEPSRIIRVTNMSVSTLTLEVDKKVSREVPVQYRFEGTLPAGYWMSVPEITPDVVEISGPERMINSVQKAACVINIGGLKESYNDKMTVRFFDANDNELKDLQLTGGAPSAIVKMDVYPYKNVKFDLSDMLVGQDKLAPGYIIKSVTVDKTSVNIAGPAEKLDAIDSLTLDKINVQNASKNIVKKLPVKVPDGVVLVDGTTEVQVVVEISEIEDVAHFDNLAVHIYGTPKSGKATVAQSYVSVDITGPKKAVNALRASDLRAYINVDGFEKGEHTAKINVRLPGSLKDATVKVSPESAKVTVK
ncbi:MAG: YbbR-like domain-containing protein [Bacillota bacterium]